MKTTLPSRSLVIKEKLDNIVKEILDVGKSKIAMIILFGSYARGDWVQDIYQQEHITYSYQSDFDLLLILKKGKYAGHQARELQYTIEKRLDKKFPIAIETMIKRQSVTLIFEPIKRVNSQLEKGQYFFCDIKKEGVLLYDSGEFILSEAQKLPWSERRPLAKEEYEYWFGRGKGFLIGVNAYLENNENALSAFSLHQATESFYNAVLLVSTGYKPKLHDILELNKQARIYHYDLYKIFPLETLEQEECFKLLLNAYVGARYDKHYKISKEQLLYLINRVEELKTVTERICLERINNTEVT
ncbi:HEPN domain-containing protein [Candidatus Tisiphia endosymbiont of Neophilaenus lineatus]|uniref:HEPN domain-containing protein n=1 Tax=Candidatus Tisiphia endosymbiont of Neophilaenus lineatus TaxID=3139336 RepID=UPI0035CBE527